MTAPTELVELRDRYEKHFVVGYDDEGRQVCETVRSPVPLHYEVDGRWREIRPEWMGGVLRGVPYSATLSGIGTASLHLVGYDGTPTVDGHRVWWHGIAPDTSAVLIASATRLQLHLILWGPNAPREWTFWMEDPDSREVGGRDNIEEYVERVGAEQFYELDVEHEVDGNLVTKRWTGRVKAVEPDTRRRYWSDDVAYPVRIV